MRVKEGVNKYGMPLIEITEINSEDPTEREKVVEEIKSWLRRRRRRSQLSPTS